MDGGKVPSVPPSLFASLSEATGLEFSPEAHRAIVVSQDCDVAHKNYVVEPRVEIIRGTIIAEANGSLLHGKSLRRLHLNLVAANEATAVELSALERREIDRRILEAAGPDSSTPLSRDQCRLVGSWLARRYRRDSFPNEFVRRLDESSERLERLYKKWGAHFTGVYLLVTPRDDELSANESYVIPSVWVTMRVEEFGKELVRHPLEDDFVPGFKKVFDGIEGVKLKHVMVVSEDAFTLHDVRNTRRLDLDSLSNRGVGEPPPDAQ